MHFRVILAVMCLGPFLAMAAIGEPEDEKPVASDTPNRQVLEHGSYPVLPYSAKESPFFDRVTGVSPFVLAGGFSESACGADLAR